VADEITVKQAKDLAKEIRIKILQMLGNFGYGHLGGSMSIADLLGVLYSGIMNFDSSKPRWEGRDYFICSKGHAGPAVYGALTSVGFFPETELLKLNRLGTNLPSHCDRLRTIGVDMTTGSLGQGLSVAVGVALGIKMDELSNYCFVVIGDGESQEGQVWEALMFAGHNKLDKLILFIDNNGEQLDGKIFEVNKIDNYVERLKSFYWHAQLVDGHDANSIIDAIKTAKSVKDCPSAIILKTIKGKGSFAEGIFNHSLPVKVSDAENDIQNLLKKN